MIYSEQSISFNMNESGYSVGGLSPVQKPFFLVHSSRLKLWVITQLYSHLLVVRKHRVNVAWLPIYLLHSNIEKMTCLEIEWGFICYSLQDSDQVTSAGLCVCTETVTALSLMHFTSVAPASSLLQRWITHKRRLVIISYLETFSSHLWFLNLIFYLEDWFFFNGKFSGCGGTFHSDNGTIKSPHWPLPFPTNSRCSWTAITHESKHWEISFDSNFRIPSSDSQCPNSFVKVGALFV